VEGVPEKTFAVKMKRFTALLAIPFFGHISISSASVEFGPFTNNANGHVYYLLTANSWSNSEAEAMALGGHLATITNATLNEWVFTNFSSHGATNKYLWIGLRAVDHWGAWTWTSGTPLTYSNWDTNEPNGTNVEYWAHIKPNGKWNDHGNWPNYTSEADLIPYQGVAEVVAGGSITNPVPITISAAIEINWITQSNKTYQVEWTPTLSTNVWSDFGSPRLGDGSTNAVFDSIIGTPMRFFRVLSD
jgi:hypothetical protein